MAQRRRRHTPEQIIRKLREGEKLLGEGAEVPEVLKHLEITEATWYRWRNQFGGMKTDDARRLKELERRPFTGSSAKPGPAERHRLHARTRETHLTTPAELVQHAAEIGAISPDQTNQASYRSASPNWAALSLTRLCHDVRRGSRSSPRRTPPPEVARMGRTRTRTDPQF
jgi:putative transposase